MKHLILWLIMALPALAATAPAITSPVAGSVLPGATVTFTWAAGTGATQYQLWVGTTKGSDNLGLCANVLTCQISKLPTNGSTVYVMLAYATSAGWQAGIYYTYTAASATPTDTLSSLTCGVVSAGGTATCTVTLSAAAPTGGFVVSLSSGSTSVSVSSSVTVAAGATTATFPAVVSSATITASAGTVTKAATISLIPVAGGCTVTATWDAPVNSPVPVTGYAIYRSAGSTFSQIATATATIYNDTVPSTGTYEYYVTSMDAAGDQSAPSNTASVTVP